MTEKWKQEYIDKMSGYSEPAPEALFDDIMDVMDHRDKNRKRIMLLIPGIAASAAAVIAAVLLLNHSGTPEVQYRDLLTDNVLEKIPAAVILPEIERPSELHGMFRRTLSGAGTPDAENAAGGSGTVSLPEERVPSEEARETVRETPDDVKEPDADYEGSARDEWQLFHDSGRERRRSRHSAFNVFASGLSGRTASHAGYSEAVTMASAFPMKYGDNSLSGIMTLNMTKDVNTETRHFLPVRAGVSFSWWFARRWSAGTGLTYSWLLSKSRTGSDENYVDSRQVLHYVGIPLNVSFDIWTASRFRVYASAGGMLEKCVGGNVGRDYYYSGMLRSSETEKLSVAPLQWSLAASAGLQFGLTRMIGLYAEPGITWYFDNGADIASVYSERPFNFSLNLGIRFSFE